MHAAERITHVCNVRQKYNNKVFIRTSFVLRRLNIVQRYNA